MPATTYSPTHFRERTIGPAGLNLRRFEGVSAAGARSRNPERSRGISTSFRVRDGKARFLRKLDLRIAAGFRCLDGFDDALNIWPKARPLLQAENHDRDSSAREVLLVRHVLIGGEQHIEAVCFCGREQLAILERVPALLRSCAHIISFQIPANGYGRLVE